MVSGVIVKVRVNVRVKEVKVKVRVRDRGSTKPMNDSFQCGKQKHSERVEKKSK